MFLICYLVIYFDIVIMLFYWKLCEFIDFFTDFIDFPLASKMQHTYASWFGQLLVVFCGVLKMQCTFASKMQHTSASCF